MTRSVEGILEGRARRTGPRLPRSALVAAIALHASVALIAFIAPRWGQAKAKPIEFVPIRLVPARALGSEVAPRNPPQAAPERPKPAEPEPTPPEPAPAPPEPKPEPRATPDPPPKAAQNPPATKPTSEPPPPTPPQQRRGSAQGNPLGTTADLGASVAGVDNPNFTYTYYLDRMLRLIEGQWRRPSTDQGVETVVYFRIQRDGSIRDLDVSKPSGSSAFDLAGLRAVQNAAPFPPLPAGYRNDSLGVNLVIR
ncbi:MAG: TonB family protein [Acidobacteriota bacterium]